MDHGPGRPAATMQAAMPAVATRAARARPGVGLAEIRPDLVRLERRLMLRSSLSLGALALLSGCDLGGEGPVDRALRAVSRFNDRVQAALFDPNRLAPTYPASAITDPFRFNAYYPEWQIRTVEEADWRLEVAGLVDRKAPWTLADLRKLPQEEQITRHVCVEGWSQVGQWSGVPFRTFLERVGADTRAGFVNVRCFDDYWCGLDMASCLHPQTILALDFEQKPLSPQWGAPLRLRLPTKLGFKNPKYIQAIEVTNTNPGGYWEKQGYNWYSGL
jgi:DMSO/TMAO reductase YedYZ molybdopterin-dependent catalytic subunit